MPGYTANALDVVKVVDFVDVNRDTQARSYTELIDPHLRVALAIHKPSKPLSRLDIRGAKEAQDCTADPWCQACWVSRSSFLDDMRMLRLDWDL